MLPLVEKLLKEVEFGIHQSYNNMLIIPLQFKSGIIDYICLDDAIANKTIEITEVDEGGSVPELFVKNVSEQRVLLLDGEELVGAKQNRILNTTILLEAGTSTKIPVSCVEAGRWEYDSRHFSSSNRISPSSLKFSKSLSVTEDLRRSSGASFRSNQHEVWDEVDNLSRKNEVHSHSRAMSDVFVNKDNDIKKYLENFSKVEGQNGMAVFINGKIVGIEYISQAIVFEKIFPKLVRGYAMDAISTIKNEPIEDPNNLGQQFIEEICKIESNSYKSVGLGEDCRFASPLISGNALVYNDEIIHFAGLQKFMEDDNIGFEDTRFIRRRQPRL